MANEFEESNKKLISEMSGAGKWQYFKDYYLKWVIAGAIAAAFVIYGLVTVFGPHDRDVLKVVVFDDYIDLDASENLEAEARDLLDAHDKHDVVNIQDGYVSTDENDLASLGVLSRNQDVDAVVAPREVFRALAAYGYFIPLESVFDDSFLQSRSDEIVSCAGYKEPDEGEDTLDEDGNGKGEVLPYGIELGSSGKWMNISTDCEDPVIGIVVESTVPENVVKFTKLLFEK